MGPEKLSAFGIIFAVLNPVLAFPAPPGEMHYGAFGSLKKLCKSMCAEAKGNSKFHDASLTCFCEIPKTTTDVTVSLLTKKAQENCMTFKILKRNSISKRETNALVLLDDIIPPNTVEKRWGSSSFENVSGQSATNTVSQRQQQNAEGSAASVGPTGSSSQRPPNVSNKKTSALSNFVKETEPEDPNLKRELDMKDTRDDKVMQVFTNRASKREIGNFLGQAFSNIIPHIKDSPPSESTEVNNQRPSSINNKKTFVLSDVKKEGVPEIPSLKREKDNNRLGDEDSQVSPNTADKRQAFLPFDFGDDLGQATPNIAPQRQQQAESKTPKGEPANSNAQRLPIISNKETLQATESREVELLPSSEHTMRRSTPSLRKHYNLQRDGMDLKITKNNPNLEREMNLEDSFDAKVSDSEDVVRQAAPNTTPQHHRQNPKASVHPESSSSQRPPNISNRKSSALSEVINEAEPEALQGESEAPVSTNTTVFLASSTSKENFLGASSDLLVNMVDEGEPKKITRRATPSPRKSPALMRATYNSEQIRRALESARQHIDTLIQRANQPSFNPSTVGMEIEAICASLRSVSHRVNESARNLERSALVEQIRERERERHARIHSRFGSGHEDRPRKLKPLLVGSANPKDKGAASKMEEPQGKKDEQKETAQKGSTIITQPPELVED